MAHYIIKSFIHSGFLCCVVLLVGFLCCVVGLLVELSHVVSISRRNVIFLSKECFIQIDMFNDVD